MGFFNGLLKGLGFETEEKKVKKDKKYKNFSTTGASFNFNEEKEKQQVPEIQQTPTNSLAGVMIESPKNQTEIQQILYKVQNGATIIVNVTNFNNTDRVRALDFMAGAMFMIGSKVQTLDGNLYLLSIQK